MVNAPAAHAQVSRPGETVVAKPHPPYPPYPPYPPGNCLRHYERPARHGWKIELVWSGGRSCPRVFFWPAKAEIWMYEGFSPPRSGPWANDRSAVPAAIYGGHQGTAADRKDAEQKADKPADQNATESDGLWWKKVTTVRVHRDGSWSASVFVEEEGPYTFAAVNSLSREFVLVEVEVWDDFGGGGGVAAPGAEAVPAAVVTASDGKPKDPMSRIGVPVASAVLVMLLALGLVLRARARRSRRATA